MKSDDGCEEKIFHLEKEACGLGRQSPRGERMHRAVSLTCGFPRRSASISDKAQTMWQSPGILEGSSQGWGWGRSPVSGFPSVGGLGDDCYWKEKKRQEFTF